MRRTCALTAATCLAALSQPARAVELGHLPGGAVSQSEMHAAADTFEVVVWGGHEGRACTAAQWRAAGSDPFAAAFNSRPLGGDYVSSTEAAFDYELKGALYRR